MAVQEIELRVPMCCRKCEDKVEIELKKMEGKVHTSWSVYSWL
jgi:copper chaperone CopZ